MLQFRLLDARVDSSRFGTNRGELLSHGSVTLSASFRPFLHLSLFRHTRNELGDRFDQGIRFYTIPVQYDSNKDTFFLQIEAFEAQCLFLAMTFASLLISFLLCVFGLGKSEMRKSAENKCKAVLGDQETELNVIGERGQANDSREQGPL